MAKLEIAQRADFRVYGVYVRTAKVKFLRAIRIRRPSQVQGNLLIPISMSEFCDRRSAACPFDSRCFSSFGNRVLGQKDMAQVRLLSRFSWGKRFEVNGCNASQVPS